MAEPFLDIRDFPTKGANRGTKRDGTFDWTSLLQQAIDALISQPDRHYTLYLPPGIYKLTSPLVIGKRALGRYLPCSLTIVGEAAALTDNLHATILSAVFKDGPALVIQSGHGVRLRRLVLRGLNDWSGTFEPTDLALHLQQDLLGTDPYLSPGIRDRRAAPHAGICIDPLHSKVPDADRYPPLKSSYPGAGGDGPASRDVVVDDCAIEKFVVGVSVAPSGFALEGEESETALALINNHITITKVGLSISGPRKVLCYSLQIGLARQCIDCIEYDGGQGRPGHCPSIYGANVGGSRYIFRTGNTGCAAHISGMFVESTLCIGQFGTQQAAPDELLDCYTFQGCAFTLINPQDEDLQYERPPLPSLGPHLLNYAQTTMQGCVLAPLRATKVGPGPPLHLVNQGYLTLDSCQLGGVRGREAPGDPDLGPQFWVSGKPEQVHYHLCATSDARWTGTSKETYTLCLSQVNSVPSFHAPPYIQGQALPGAMYLATEHRAALDEDLYKYEGPTPSPLRWVDGLWPLIPLGRKARTDFTVLSHDPLDPKYHRKYLGLPTGQVVVSVDKGLVQVGDVLMARKVDGMDEVDLLPGVLATPAGGAGPLLLGRVTQVDAMGAMQEKLTVSFLPVFLWKLLTTVPPMGTPDVSLALYIVHFPRIHPPTKGRVLKISKNVIRDVKTFPVDISNRPAVPPIQGWGIGHRIFGHGIIGSGSDFGSGGQADVLS